MTRISFEYSPVFLPDFNDGLVGGPSEYLEVFGEIEGSDENQHMGLQAFQVWAVEGLDRGFLDGAVHPLGLPVGPRVIGLGQLVHDAIFITNPAKDVHAQKGLDGAT